MVGCIGGGSTFEIREGGVYRTEGAFAATDVFKVAVEGTTVKYYRNGALVYTSKTPVSGKIGRMAGSAAALRRSLIRASVRRTSTTKAAVGRSR